MVTVPPFARDTLSIHSAVTPECHVEPTEQATKLSQYTGPTFSYDIQILIATLKATTAHF